MGRLELFIGPMFSGKSTLLINNIRELKLYNNNILIIKPIIDNRYGDDNNIISHDKIKEECLLIKDLDISNIDDETIKQYSIIAIDEGHFFANLKNKVIYWVENLDKHVLISGLDGDYLRNPIGEILDLIPYADKYKKSLEILCILNFEDC